MYINDILPIHWIYLPWLIGGAWVGDRLVTLARVIPEQVLQKAEAPIDEWQGPGGGLKQPVPAGRRLWVPALNAGLWVYAASTATEEIFWGALLWACLASTLLLLALADWDTTMLPDRVVLPLGLAGLAASYAGLTTQSLIASAAAAAVMLGLLGGLGWVYKRIKGESGMGGGDLKLLAALAAWWGMQSVLSIVIASGIITVLWYAMWRRFKNLSPEAEWPFGPAIVFAALGWSMLAAYSSGTF
jgi:leader peptidase (prepilin peptidase)/N-methyltransferase